MNNNKKIKAEFSPECYLPQPDLPDEEQRIFCEKVTKSILQTAVCVEDIAEEVIKNFPDHSTLPDLPYGTVKTVEAVKKRIRALKLALPENRLQDGTMNIAEKIMALSNTITDIMNA